MVRSPSHQLYVLWASCLSESTVFNSEQLERTTETPCFYPFSKLYKEKPDKPHCVSFCKKKTIHTFIFFFQTILSLNLLFWCWMTPDDNMLVINKRTHVFIDWIFQGFALFYFVLFIKISQRASGDNPTRWNPIGTPKWYL